MGHVLRLRRSPHWQEDSSFDSLLSRAGLGCLGKGCIVRGITTRRLTYWDNGLFYPSWNRLYRFTYSLSVAVRPTARNWPDTKGLYTGRIKRGKIDRLQGTLQGTLRVRSVSGSRHTATDKL